MSQACQWSRECKAVDTAPLWAYTAVLVMQSCCSTLPDHAAVARDDHDNPASRHTWRCAGWQQQRGAGVSKLGAVVVIQPDAGAAEVDTAEPMDQHRVMDGTHAGSIKAVGLSTAAI